MQTDTSCFTEGLQAGCGQQLQQGHRTAPSARGSGATHPQTSWVVGSSLSRDTPDVTVTYPSPIM